MNLKTFFFKFVPITPVTLIHHHPETTNLSEFLFSFFCAYIFIKISSCNGTAKIRGKTFFFKWALFEGVKVGKLRNTSDMEWP